MKKRVGIRVPENVERELDYFRKTYNVTEAYVLLLAYKLSDRKKLEQLLALQVKN